MARQGALAASATPSSQDACHRRETPVRAGTAGDGFQAGRRLGSRGAGGAAWLRWKLRAHAAIRVPRGRRSRDCILTPRSSRRMPERQTALTPPAGASGLVRRARPGATLVTGFFLIWRARARRRWPSTTVPYRCAKLTSGAITHWKGVSPSSDQFPREVAGATGFWAGLRR
jgi:hypothetical protein